MKTHTVTPGEHPFAEFIRILGRGKKGARPLTQAQAQEAMRMILASETTPEQIGAFLMLMRVKEETAEELAGFTLAARMAIHTQFSGNLVDLDWPSYAGKRRHLPWFLLAAWLLAQHGVRILMHGSSGPSIERLYTIDAVRTLGLPEASTLEEAALSLTRHRFVYLALENFSPLLQRLLDLRTVLGLRSPIHTLVRMLNPWQAPYSVHGIFHPNYRVIHQAAAQMVGQPHMAVWKGEGGEAERNPCGVCLVQSVRQGELFDEEWPPLLSQRHPVEVSLKPEKLRELWQGTWQDSYAEASVIGTLAITLRLLGHAPDPASAEALAHEWWRTRDTSSLGLVQTVHPLGGKIHKR